jgi:hypothetical protein
MERYSVGRCIEDEVMADYRFTDQHTSRNIMYQWGNFYRSIDTTLGTLIVGLTV